MTTTTDKKPAAKAKATKPAKDTLQVDGEPGELERIVADLATEGLLTNVGLVRTYSKQTIGEVGLTEATAALRASVKKVNGGDLVGVETMLVSQASALNAIFCELARRASLNMGEYLDATEKYMRLALKAQGQCRATLETLAAIKNPPLVFARQANINNGGQQQVNNGTAPPQRADATHTEQPASRPNELLEDCTHGGTQMDPGATTAAGRTNQGLEPVAAFNRPANR